MSNVKMIIEDKKYLYEQPWFYNNKLALRCELGVGNGVKYLKRVKWNSVKGEAYTTYHKLSDLTTYKIGGTTYYHGTDKTRSYSYYAKGTLGTKKDEWAITDESWIGEEITLAAGKNGQLQYLKKGSAVMPADISANLVEWGKLDPNMMNLTNPTANINMINNAVSRPEFNLTFDSLVHVDHCDEGTLKNLEKMVDTKINDFSKQLNYSIKKFAR